jgi:hypothetical protein
VDAVPVISRGHNVAIMVPPVADAARPLLDAVAGRRLFVLAPDTDRAILLAEALEPALTARAARVVGVSSPGRGARQLAGPHDVACVGAQDALALLRQSALPLAGYGALALAWPEQLDEDGRTALEAVMAEADRDAQRIILTGETGPDAMKLVERYAFKAMTFGFPPAEPSPGAAPRGTLGAARYVIAPAERFRDVRRRVLDALAPASDDGVLVTTAPESRDAAQALLQAAGDTPPVIVAEPFQLAWLRTLFAPLTPLPVAGAAHVAEQRGAVERRRIAHIAEHEDLSAELVSLAPLLRQFDAALVAAAALRIARMASRGTASLPAVAQPAPGAGGGAAYAKIWVGIGKKDNVRPGDLVGALANQAQVPPDALGRIEVRDLFCLVEIRADQAERAVTGLTGVTVKGRRIVARVDKGPGGGHRPPRRV